MPPPIPHWWCRRTSTPAIRSPNPADRAHIAQTLAQAYVCARLADLPVALTRESDGIGSDARLYLAPSVKQLLAPTGATLERLAADGACVYLSYSPGDTAWHRGPSYGRLNEMFGVRHQLDVGLSNPVEDDVVTFRLSRDFGGLARGTTLSFAAAGDRHSRGFLPARARRAAGAAEVLATDARGLALARRRRARSGRARSCCALTRSNT